MENSRANREIATTHQARTSSSDDSAGGVGHEIVILMSQQSTLMADWKVSSATGT
uniref:Uncharacterized protein n=1 Tax=Hyaloperonospora arabidopsidis (strain Emoy2) TaxID=559515 RepID=M4C4R7_HYAAE